MVSPLQFGDARLLEEQVHEQARIDGRGNVAVAVYDIFGRCLTSSCPESANISWATDAHNKALTVLRFEIDTVRFRHSFNHVDDCWEWAERPGGGDVRAEVLPVLAATHPNFCHLAGGVAVVRESSSLTVGALGVAGLLELENHELAQKVMANSGSFKGRLYRGA